MVVTMIIKKAQLSLSIITAIMSIIEWLKMIDSDVVWWMAVIITIATITGMIMWRVMR